MLLLTWHGTILRVEQLNRRLTHAPLTPARPLGVDFDLDLPSPLTAPHPAASGLEAVPAARPGLIHLRRGGLYLSVDTYAPFPLSDREAPGDWETLLPIGAAPLAALRRLLAAPFRREDTGEHHAAGALRISPDFILHLAGAPIDLTQAAPEALPENALALTVAGARITLTPLAEPEEAEWHLRAAPAEQHATPVETPAAWRATPNSRLPLESPPERVFLPLTLSRADSDWLYRNPWNGWAPFAGQARHASAIVHEADRYVLLERFVEGMVFHETGVTNTQGYLGNLSRELPPTIRREAEQYFVPARALREAPRLAGNYAVFYGGNLSNYFHWLIDAMVPLTLLAPHLPPDTTLLLPGTLKQLRGGNGRFDHIEALEAFGFGDLPRVEIDAGIVHVERVFWADRCFIEDISAETLRATRGRALDRLPPAGAADRRLFIRRRTSRGFANQDEVELFARKSGFTMLDMEDLSTPEQIDMFRHAAFVIGTHGAALANLMFCPPGTRVIELAPDEGYRPFFNFISSKLGLTHAILPCPTDNGGFFGNLIVDIDRLRGLRRLLERRL